MLQLMPRVNPRICISLVISQNNKSYSFAGEQTAILFTNQTLAAAREKKEFFFENPITRHLFAIKAELEWMASRKISVPSAIFIYIVTISVFLCNVVVLFTAISPPQIDIVIQSEWQKTVTNAHRCKKIPSHYRLMHTCYDDIFPR